MTGLAVNVAVIHEGKILLTQREDFETWILPSGGVEDGESLAQAAIRETREETGAELIGLRDKSGVSRSEFYRQWTADATIKESVELSGSKAKYVQSPKNGDHL